MKMNLKGWHKVASDKTHTTLRDPQGHELRVCHSALSKQHKGALDKLPVKMAEGGMVNDQSGMEAIKKENYKQSPTKYVSMANGGVVERLYDGGIAGEEDANSSRMPDPMSPDQQVASIQEQAALNVPNPDQQRLQQLYNIDVATKHIGDPNDPSAMDMMLGGGQDPKRLDPVSMQKAQLGIQAEKVAEAEKQQRGIQDVTEQNALRAQAGLPPLPVPPALSPSSKEPSITPVSQNIFKDLEAFGAQSAPQMGTNVPAAEPKGSERVMQGMRDQTAAITQQAARDEAILAKQERDIASAEQEFKNQWQALDEQRKTIQSELEKDQINPNRFWDNQNVGQKIGTAIGMIMGGVGAGMQHTENPVLKMVNTAIEADIQAQKANLGKKENLLAANMRQFGNVKDAMTMTRMMQQDAVLTRLKRSMATAQGPQAKALLAQEIGKLEMQQSATAQRFTLERTLASQAEKDPSSVPTLIQQVRTFDPKRASELESQYVPGMGLALTSKGADQLKELKATVDTAKDGLLRLRAMTYIPGRTIDPKLRAEANVISQSLVGLLRVPITGPGAMNEGERKMLETIVADPSAVFSLDSATRTRLSSLVGRLNQSLAMTAKANGISSYDAAKSLSPQARQLADWARNNPQDTRSQQVLDKLGL